MLWDMPRTPGLEEDCGQGQAGAKEGQCHGQQKLQCGKVGVGRDSEGSQTDEFQEGHSGHFMSGSWDNKIVNTDVVIGWWLVLYISVKWTCM